MSQAWSKNDHVLKLYGMTHVGKHTIGAASHHIKSTSTTLLQHVLNNREKVVDNVRQHDDSYECS
jgi:hypothetical protein